MTQIIALLGYMGSGKSTIGRALAKAMDCSFDDLDHLIEKESSLSISELFADRGEIAFRKMESQVLQSYLETTSSGVLALGGGTPCYGNNLKLLHEMGAKTVYLQLSVASLLERLKAGKDKRPLIAHLDDEQLEEFIRKHLFERQYYYNQAQCVVDLNDLSVPSAVDRVKTACFYSK